MVSRIFEFAIILAAFSELNAAEEQIAENYGGYGAGYGGIGYGNVGYGGIGYGGYGGIGYGGYGGIGYGGYGGIGYGGYGGPQYGAAASNLYSAANAAGKSKGLAAANKAAAAHNFNKYADVYARHNNEYRNKYGLSNQHTLAKSNAIDKVAAVKYSNALKRGRDAKKFLGYGGW